MQELINYQDELLKTINKKFFRFLYDRIEWDQRMIAIKGPRGTGKTTLMLQKIKYGLPKGTKALYITTEHQWFFTNSLFDTASDFYKMGGQYLFIDEVHKYERWSRELKVIYDGFPDLKIVFSASSALEIYRGEADLSRRVISYNLPGLSFREYLEFIYGFKFDPFGLEEILFEHQSQVKAITSGIRVLPLFHQYIQTGYLPITKQLKPQLYPIAIQNILNSSIEIDIQIVSNMPVHSLAKLKRILGMIAQVTPYEPNISSIAQKVGISRNTVLNFIHSLEKARILNFLVQDKYGISNLQKPDKIFLENTNLNYTLEQNPNIGTVRETFFLNQLRNAGYKVTLPEKHDFLVTDKYIFEVGGKNKSLSGKSVFIAADGIEVGWANKIPLWLFGFLY
ncbi:hypothetical protein ES708_19490 [subsurface metagenome]